MGNWRAQMRRGWREAWGDVLWPLRLVARLLPAIVAYALATVPGEPPPGTWAFVCAGLLAGFSGYLLVRFPWRCLWEHLVRVSEDWGA